MKTGHTEALAQAFLNNAKSLHADVEPIRVLKARAYRIGNANVLIRAASKLPNDTYFFGLNYITAEEVANLENAYFAFICGGIEQTMIIPASALMDHLPVLSRDRNGEYKIVFDHDLNMKLSGRNNRMKCAPFLNSWDELVNPSLTHAITTSAEDTIHSVIQGRLLEIGNIRGFETFCPNKSRKFNGRKLADIATLNTCPSLQFSDYEVLRQIDVLWFKEKGSYHLPECGFEVELTTGTWSGVGRLAQLIDYSNVRLYVISAEERQYQKVMSSFAEIRSRYKYLPTDVIGDLYAAELSLRTVREKIGL